MSVLLDAGPALNFLAVKQENVLIQLAETRNLELATAEQVDREVRGMAHNPRFSRTAVAGRWITLVASERITVRSDDLNDLVFQAAVARISGLPAVERARSAKSLGEIMVLAHASTLAQTGSNTYVLMDDQDGRARAAGERDWLLAAQATGQLVVWNTKQVLVEASQHDGWISNGKTWPQVYRQMMRFDEGLPRP